MNMKQHTAQLQYLKIAPRKVRRITDTLKGLSVGEAEAQLMLGTERSRLPILKLLRSAIANAKESAPRERLAIQSIRVDNGPMLKRALPRAQGRTTPIHKIMSHVTLVLEEKETGTPPRFVIIPPPKKKKDEEKGKTPKQSPGIEKRPAGEPKKEKRGGFFRKIFSRKSMAD